MKKEEEEKKNNKDGTKNTLFFILSSFFCLFFPYFFHHFLLCTACHLQERTIRFFFFFFFLFFVVAPWVGVAQAQSLAGLIPRPALHKDINHSKLVIPIKFEKKKKKFYTHAFIYLIEQSIDNTIIIHNTHMLV
jgi:hypothetical protein